MTILDPRERVAAVAEGLLARGERLAVAESCTGGLIAAWLTDRPGSSGWFECGLVTYSNAAKQALLGVPAETLEACGAVSGPTVLAMTAGLLQRAGVDWGLAVSGIAGPSGGSPDKPVGTVWIAWQGPGVAPSASRFLFRGDRQDVRHQAALAALHELSVLIAARN
ncbi:MAG TPA: CinA family protein [Nevskiaceae bacterium]|nr:CinA family protein [Nevskiaceae bacterium]